MIQTVNCLLKAGNMGRKIIEIELHFSALYAIIIASFRIHDKKGGEDKACRARRRTQAG